MEKVVLRRPFFVVNPKSYLYGEGLRDLAKKVDELCEKHRFQSLFTAQLIDLAWVAENCPHLIPCAQNMESLRPGRGMGHILPEALAAAGVKATFLNHAENPMTVSELAKTIRRAREVGILTCVCADSVDEARAIAELHPDIMTCELTELIGTGKIAGPDYIRQSTAAVKEVSPETMVLQAAGISTGQDVYDAIIYGGDATGGTSGIVAAADPFSVLDEMFEALDRARADIRERG
ncbi:MAG: triose-phosphate isomerase [Coriobacteriaceae bacterium]|uniref:triose-phosphate isomerase n=1 Tax=Tractidigestivibacter sp. TaxID=2847320 RepID=UPI002A80446C|nr:triose-phosphate isomerase [Tractidigestivibacter sp.]MCI6274888.1 triose-phosphate isomerase [Coriobacteriaceae bacterium]MCI6547722.1 triose-phosphate isomerase [Coriobacteriaceae bacterium]MCI6843444.1 triose-phosphate isomerase [Coriobacteriaceae bacterium]MCI7438348.1 triose-phosphate isomerase [Coriobacteriaceae bacterium]MDD7583232.1 triose-phosphate isomerase [Coriobacteriaceae bacterium]